MASRFDPFASMREAWSEQQDSRRWVIAGCPAVGLIIGFALADAGVDRLIAGGVLVAFGVVAAVLMGKKGEVLDLPIEDALSFFEAVPAIARHLSTLVDVGLGYVRMGQSAPTLSGGEAQRVKLASELQKRSTGRTVYVLDEPTTGLHFEDIRKLLGVLQSLVDKGNTVIVIEHNLDVIKSADWIVDLGPEGGSGGGTVVAEGTPESVAAADASHTGRFLQALL